jgi:hypothetical protein
VRFLEVGILNLPFSLPPVLVRHDIGPYDFPSQINNDWLALTIEITTVVIHPSGSKKTIKLFKEMCTASLLKKRKEKMKIPFHDI